MHVPEPGRRLSGGLSLARPALHAVWVTLFLATGCGEAQPEGGEPGLLGQGTAALQAPETAPGAANGEPGGTRNANPLEERPASTTFGLDAELLAEAAARAAELPRLYTMIVARHGEVELEAHFRGPGPAQTTNVKSASKSILSALVGLAVEEGYLEGLDQPIADYFGEFLDPEADAAKYGITVRDLLTMQSGLESTSSGNYGRWVLSSHWVRHAITRPMVSDPGVRMVYSTGNSHLLSALLTRATGSSTHAFAQTHLAAPLGIRIPPWLSDPQGVYFGGNDMQVSARDLLRFGELYRNGGTLEGRQILSREWVEDSWRVHARSPRNGNTYGLGWWGRDSNGHSVRFAWGYGGQFVFVVPALELTVVFTSDPVSPREGPHNRALHEMIDRLLVPAALRGSQTSRTEQATLPRTDT